MNLLTHYAFASFRVARAAPVFFFGAAPLRRGLAGAPSGVAAGATTF
jgi:hypothetical protein